ncbi:GAP1-N1 domain-containing protein [Limnobaculum xujianqingii]|uniref:GAP1-N1 domain-containing protein n=1 Tax=Limnobaculum xujianqingii TaxID=2738837 RepID=UPI00112927C9|nr:effector-associated domain EAD1-containing protein [Limnobaculum xujianqingii]
MRVEQAIYGESRGGHGLKMATSEHPIISELTSRLDLPDTAPPGVDWSPFVSGFPYREYFVLSRTFADPSATRSGMVLSHAVIAKLSDVINMPDLRPLFGMLLTKPIIPDIFVAHDLSEIAEQRKSIPELISLANALVTRGRGPVVRFNVKNFEELIAALWVFLWPEIRSKFSFRLSFGPQDIIDEIPPAVICTPSSLASRWTTYRVVGDIVQSSSLAAEILCDEMKAALVMELAQQVGAKIYQFSELPLLQHIYEIDTHPNPQFDECVSALRILEKLSPDPNSGITRKNIFIQRLEARLPSASVQDILLLRNLVTNGLPNATTIWDNLKKWAATKSLAPSEDDEILSALSDALCVAAAVEPWRVSIIDGLILGLNTYPRRLASAFWRWAKLNPKILIEFAKYLPLEDKIEIQIANAVPEVLDLDTGNIVMAIAQRRNWLVLHGTAASICLTSSDAIARQLSVDIGTTELDGLRAALRCTSSMETIELSLAQPNEPRLIQLAAERIADEPSLLDTLNFTLRLAQDLWCYALTINSEAWRGINDPSGAFSIVLQNLVEGSEVNLHLIEALSFTPLADLSKHIKNSDVWMCLPETARSNCLHATANGWLHCALKGYVYYPDNELEMAVLENNNLDVVLRSDKEDIGAILRIINHLPNIQESQVLRWLDEHALTKTLRSVDADELGRIIYNRRWSQIVEILLNHAKKGRNDIKPALSQCRNMVGLFSRFILGLSSISNSDKWALLEEIVVELYPNGPDDQGLWERAGGKDADLRVNGSGRNRWHDAISYLQRGRGPLMSRLFEEMQNDYPQNDKLRALWLSRYF